VAATEVARIDHKPIPIEKNIRGNRGSSFRSGAGPAAGAEAEEFEGVGDGGKAVEGFQLALDLAEAAIADVKHFAARSADQMVVVVVAGAAATGDQFEARLAVAEVAAGHDPGSFKMSQAPEDGGPIPGAPEFLVDLVDAQRAPGRAEVAEDGEASGRGAQSLGSQQRARIRRS